ncbi:disulfide bond formation protein B [Desulfobacula sp.]|uniref:disulfide bond formation protein B n=2 Tax=Desulfobacula sp. TaxID=2593537 RepID=UPI0039B8FA40
MQEIPPPEEDREELHRRTQIIKLQRDFTMAKPDNQSDANWTLLFLTWLIVSASTLGSLFFSHVMEFAPCVLCWYQRICLFPLVIILAAGLFPFDKSVVRYALPLSIAGWLTAFYHNLVYSGFIPQELQPCSQGASCTEKYIDLFGFLTIPMLSLLSFSIIITLLFILKRRIS